jgi:hypothetical protein
MVGLSLLVLLVPLIFFHGEFNHWLQQAITLLVISCPCALGHIYTSGYLRCELEMHLQKVFW